MKIISMTATFGCLNHATLEFKDGLNLFTMPNEQGKSTWCAFLRVMLYGLNTRERDKRDALADKSRYRPWNGAPMEGELRCEWKGRELCVRRTSRGANPMDYCEITWADTGDAIPELNASNLGDVLIGVSREVFERSAFLSQKDFAVTQTGELEKRLAALVSSGEDGVSASQVQKQLLDWQRDRRYRTRGEIPELQARLAETTERLESIKDATTRIRKAQTEIDRCKLLEQQLLREMSLHELMRAADQAQAYQDAQREAEDAAAALARVEESLPNWDRFPSREELLRQQEQVGELRAVEDRIRSAEVELDPAEAALAQAEEICADQVFSGTAEDAEKQAGEDLDKLSALESEQGKLGNGGKMTAIACFALAVAILAVVALVFRSPAIAIAAAMIPVVWGIVALSNGKRKVAAKQEEINAVLARYQARDARGITQSKENYIRRLNGVERARNNLARLHQMIDDLQQKKEKMSAELAEFVSGFAPEATDRFGYTAALAKALTGLEVLERARERKANAERIFTSVAAHGEGETVEQEAHELPSIPLDEVRDKLDLVRRRISGCESEKAMALGQRGTTGDPDALQAEVERLQQEIEKKEAEFLALTVAMEAMAQSETALRERFSPELNRIASDYFARLTQGRYEWVRLSRELEASAGESGSVDPRAALSLSRGATDQLWLAVRLAVCDLALPEKEKCPLVLDDVFAGFDDARTAEALRLFEEISAQRQVILFSCQSRESRILQAN